MMKKQKPCMGELALIPATKYVAEDIIRETAAKVVQADVRGKLEHMLRLHRIAVLGIATGFKLVDAAAEEAMAGVSVRIDPGYFLNVLEDNFVLLFDAKPDGILHACVTRVQMSVYQYSPNNQTVADLRPVAAQGSVDEAG